MKAKVDIFSGFLGAGKTMLIKKLITEKLSSENIVIIENEFGQVGIDGNLLKNTNINVKEINSGCICCSILGDFKQAILDIINQYKPTRILIEPTGVAKLSEVINVFKDPLIKELTTINIVITVVDILKYELYIANFNEFYSDQIKNAKTVVLSRTQKVDQAKILKISNSIRTLNSKASIVTTPWEDIHGENIIEAGELDVKESLNNKINLLRPHSSTVNFRVNKVSKNEHRADHVFQSWSYETAKTFDTTHLISILNKLKNHQDYGKVLRAKGILQTPDKKWLQFDLVPEEYEIRETPPDYTGRICVIGNNLANNNLLKLFSQ